MFLLVIFSSLCGCYDVTTNHQLSLTNKSNRNISILYSNLAEQPLTENNVAYYTNDRNVIYPDSCSEIIQLGGKNAWHNYIEKSQSKKLYIFIFETDTLKKYEGVYSMENFVNRHKYLKLFCYSEIDLNKIAWRITVNK